MKYYNAPRHAQRNDYSHRKWNRRHEFKSWTKLFAFPFVLMPFGKARIHLSSPASGWTEFFGLRKATSVREVKLDLNQLCFIYKNWPSIASCPWMKGWIDTYYSGLDKLWGSLTTSETVQLSSGIPETRNDHLEDLHDEWKMKLSGDLGWYEEEGWDKEQNGSAL